MPPPCTLSFADKNESFTVNRIFCVGSNYLNHIQEMGNMAPVECDFPCFFMKPADNLLAGGGKIPYPSRTENLHHEIELAIALQKNNNKIAPYGYATALDLTRRDLQHKAKQLGQPWTVAKCFPCAAPCSPLISASNYHPDKQAIRLSVNGSIKQDSNLDQMLWKIPDIIAFLDDFLTVNDGDLLLTGTPSGVGPLQIGDQITGTIEGLPTLNVEIITPIKS